MLDIAENHEEEEVNFEMRHMELGDLGFGES